MGCKSSDLGYRALVLGIENKIPLKNGNYVTAINFDNAATTPPFVSVMKAVNNFAPWYSSIHRGTGYKSQLSSNIYENSRAIVLDFIGGDKEKDIVIYVRNTTEAINKLSYRLTKKYTDSVILSSTMEHHSNDLPWRDKFQVDYIPLTKNGRINIPSLEAKLKFHKGRVKLITLTGASNVTGYINPIHEAASLAHNYGAEILIDGAQLVPHMPINIKPHTSKDHIDYLVFSAHKMYAPFGIGVLIGPKNSFLSSPPEEVGGGTVKFVTHNEISWEDAPIKEEAGSPNVIGVHALVEAINTLKLIGMQEVKNIEEELTHYCLQKLKTVPRIIIYGDNMPSVDRLGIIPFNMEGLRHDILANALSQYAGIAVRNGCFCAHPYIQRLLDLSAEEIDNYLHNTTLPKPGMVRVSFGLYNTKEEIDIFIDTLIKIAHLYK